MTAILIICEIFVNTSLVYAEETNYNERAYLDLIDTYYELINDGRHTDIVGLYGDELAEEVSDFFCDSDNYASGEGIFGVCYVDEIEKTKVSSKAEYIYRRGKYKNVNVYFVKCIMDVDSSDKYFVDGVNYFLFYVGVDSQNQMKIINVEIPMNEIIISFDANVQDSLQYISNRNFMLYGNMVENMGENTTGIARQTYESPIYVDSVSNPSNIRIKTDNGVVTRDLRDYCKTVAAGEITVLEKDDALRACALAIKMFAIHHILSAGSGVNYDINSTDQIFDESKVRKEACNNAVDYIFNYFLLDEYGSMFKTFYRKSSSSTDGEFCRQNGGILSQLGADDLAYAGKGWQYILRYYYQRSLNVSYYNTAVSYGTLIITTTHVHDWSSGVICNFCGASAE